MYLCHIWGTGETQELLKAYELNVPIIMIKETYHKGNMPLKFEGIRVSAENIIASVFKRSEDGNGYVIRCYETAGKLTSRN